MLLGPNKWLHVCMERFIERSMMELECHRMISRGRSSRTMEPHVLARIIQSHFQVRRLDLNVCAPVSLVSWKVNDPAGTSEVLTEHLGGDLLHPQK